MTLRNLNEIMNHALKKYNNEFISDDYFIDDNFKHNFKKISGNDIIYHNCYAEVTSSQSLKIYIPYQWFIIASYFIEYYKELKKYKNTIETVKNQFTDFSDTIKNCRDNETSAKNVVDHIQGITNEEKTFLVKFLSDYTWWGGGKTGGGKTIDRSDFYVSPILNSAKLVNNTQAYVAEIVKEFAEHPQAVEVFGYQKANIIPNSTSFLKPSSFQASPSQTIFYGVPGCGKSHSVDKIINNAITEFNKGKDSECQITYDKQVIRTVFHPDYCNADFVGQIMPKKKGNGIDYEFKPGPLATIIRKAYLNPSKPYFLIIEEINRGNASAIFGETFQLLDRYKNGKHSSEEEIRNENYDYTEGWSKYSINNDDLNGFILLGGESNVTEKEPGVDYESDSSETPKSAIKIPSIGLHFSTYSGIRLPPNLSLYATMNTSDQNVFTLDNAFQRRWEMKLIPNELKNNIPEDATDEQKKEIKTEVDQYNEYIGGTKDEGGTGVKWGEFRKKINEIIMQSADENGLSSMEDKRLGGWFITPKKDPEAGENAESVITKKAFAEKVLKYLWDDAFKFDRKAHFDNRYKTLEDLINAFVGGEGFKVFTDTSINGPKQEASTDEPAATES